MKTPVEKALYLLTAGSDDRNWLSTLAENFVDASKDAPAETERLLVDRIADFPPTSLLEVLYALNELEWQAQTDDFVEAMEKLVRERPLFTSVTASVTLLKCHEDGLDHLERWAEGEEGNRWEAVRALLTRNGIDAGGD